jgi:hypothetical protein
MGVTIEGDDCWVSRGIILRFFKTFITRKAGVGHFGNLAVRKRFWEVNVS